MLTIQRGSLAKINIKKTYSKNVDTITKNLAETLADTLAEDQVETLGKNPEILHTFKSRIMDKL